MAKQYIEKKTLIDDILSLDVTVCGKSIFNDDAKSSVLRVIDEQPTADVQEVRHSKWEYEDSDIGWTDYRCDSCGNIITTVADPDELYQYCPYCGAKMDKE